MGESHNERVPPQLLAAEGLDLVVKTADYLRDMCEQVRDGTMDELKEALEDYNKAKDERMKVVQLNGLARAVKIYLKQYFRERGSSITINDIEEYIKERKPQKVEDLMQLALDLVNSSDM